MSGLARTAQRVRGAACSVIVVLASGCASMHTDGNFLGILQPYRIDIVQGNVLTKDQIERVRPGMSRVQVRDVLGSPLLTDLFHADRWAYVFTIRRPGVEPVRRAVVVIFEGDRLLRVDAPDLPTEREFVAQIGRPPSGRELPVLELTEEQRKALPVPAKLAPDAAPESIPGPARNYPPLEPPR